MFEFDEDKLKLVQNDLKMYITEYCKSFSLLWADYLENTSVKTGFLDLLVLKVHEDGENQTQQLRNYQDLFESNKERKIFILGEPGCGKSMYVRKLALDWADGDEYLRSKFDTVLFFDKYLLTTTVSNGLHQFVSHQLHSFLLNLLEKSERVLIIFDGINEIDAETEIFSEIKNIVEHKLYPSITVLVTSRIPQIYSICYVPNFVWIDGFIDSAFDEFIKMQKCEQTFDEKISDLLHLPLFCTIYCLLQRSGISTAAATDTFDLIKCYVDHHIQNYAEKSGKLATKEMIVHELMMMLGKFALVHLIGNPHEEELKDLKLVITQNAFDCENLSINNILHFGLLKEKKVPTGKHFEFKQEFNVAHQLIAEYLAAYYVANIFNIDVNMMHRRFGWWHIPIKEYILYNILFLWEDGKFSNKSVDTIFKNGDNYLMCYCKRPNNRILAEVVEAKQSCFMSVRGIGRNVHLFNNIAKCKNLSFLLLYNSYVTSHSANVLAKGMDSGLFKNLDKLRIENDWKIGSAANLFASLANCENLCRLFIENCNITSESAKALANGMDSGKFLNLKTIFILSNPTIGQESKFFSSLAKCPNLTQLGFAKCNITLESIESFTAAINSGLFQNLEEADFWFNKEIGSAVEFFLSLSKLPKITSLCLSNCDITSASLQSWAKGMKLNKFNTLQKLDISGNENVGKEISFMNEIANCNDLQHLVVYDCNLTLQVNESLNVLRNRECLIHESDTEVPPMFTTTI